MRPKPAGGRGGLASHAPRPGNARPARTKAIIIKPKNIAVFGLQPIGTLMPIRHVHAKKYTPFNILFAHGTFEPDRHNRAGTLQKQEARTCSHKYALPRLPINMTALTSKYSSKAIATRLKKVEKKIRDNTAELKVYQDGIPLSPVVTPGLAVHQLNNLPLGTGDEERIGLEIKVQGFRLHTKSQNEIVDVMLVLSRDGITPVIGDFLNAKPTQIDCSHRHNLKVIKYLYNFSGQNHQTCHFEKRYKTPLQIGWNQAGICTKNCLYLCVLNRGAVAHDYSFSWSLYYRDS